MSKYDRQYTAEALKAVSMGAFEDAVQNAVATGHTYAVKNPEGQHWYPCGFAQLSIHIRKNDRRSKILLNNGFRWDDYNKSYYLYGGRFTNSQSMNYKESILDAVQDVLTAAGIPSNVSTRMD